LVRVALAAMEALAMGLLAEIPCLVLYLQQVADTEDTMHLLEVPEVLAVAQAHHLRVLPV
jgi:hypothetical protein